MIALIISILLQVLTSYFSFTINRDNLSTMSWVESKLDFERNRVGLKIVCGETS